MSIPGKGLADMGPFVIVPEWLLEAMDALPAPGSTLRMWCALWHYADNDTRECWPAFETLCARAGLRTTAGGEALARLRQLRAVEVSARTNGNGRCDTNSYLLHPDYPPARRGTPRRTGGGPPGRADPRTPRQTGPKLDPTTKPTGTRTPPTPPVGGEAALLPPEADRSMDAHFEEFWTTYGRIGPKRKARECWDRAVRKATPDVILAGLRRWVAYWATPEAAKVKWPQGWLNEERWDAEPPQPAASRRRERGYNPFIDQIRQEGA